MTTSDMEKGFQEIWKLFAETDKRLDKMFKETREEIKATDRQLKETDKKLNKLIGTWGSFVEGLVKPAAVRMFQERGIDVEEIWQGETAEKNGQDVMEIDLLLTDGEYTVLIEVKTTLKVDDVKEHIDRLNRFKECVPRFADSKVIGAVAGIVISKGADKFAYKQGLFVIAQSGDSVTILNDKNFKPKEW